MPIQYALNLSEYQIRFLYWINDGCPEGETKSWLFAGVQYIRVARKIESLGYAVADHYNHAMLWTLTLKGRALIELIKMEVSL